MWFSKRTCAIASLCVAILGYFPGTVCVATNRTIDDNYGDSVTGDLPVYLPPNFWTQGSQCRNCSAQPDRARVFGQTWQDATLRSEYEELNVTMRFTGTAVYAYCIPANNPAYGFLTHLVFSIDGEQVGSFLHNPDGSDTYLYDQLVYGNSSLQNIDHVFVIHVPRGPSPTLTLFDYVRYTYDSEHPTSSTLPSHPSTSSISSTTPLPASSENKKRSSSKIVGIILGPVLGLVLFIAITIFLLRRRRRPNAKRLSRLDLAEPDLHLQPLNTSYSIYTEPTPTHIELSTPPTPPSQPPSASGPSLLGQDPKNSQRLLRLEARSSSTPGESHTGDAWSLVPAEGMPNQVDHLRHEVERLRGMLAPPPYRG